MSKPKIPSEIERAVDMLNDPWSYPDELEHHLNSLRYYGDAPSRRILAEVDWMPVKEKWCLYVEWDDSEPLSARHLVHEVIRTCGLETFIATGCGVNYDEDAEDNQKFSGSNVSVSFLRVGPTGRALKYTCEECDETTGNAPREIKLQFGVGD